MPLEVNHSAPGAVFLRDIDVAARYSLSRNTPWKWARAAKAAKAAAAEGVARPAEPGTPDDFPLPVVLGRSTTRWRLADLIAWESRQSPAHI